MRFGNNILYHTICDIHTERNECDEISNQCEQNCHNTAGSYNCSCNTGYTLNSDGHACDGRQGLTTTAIVADYNDCIADVNECDSVATNDCQHTCVNTLGSYVCQCNTGYRLNSDGRTCTGETD